MNIFQPERSEAAHVSPALGELEQLAYEATSALEAAKRSSLTTIERYRDAGAALIKAKKKCKYGEWIPFLQKHKISRTAAWRAIVVAMKCSAAKHLEDPKEVDGCIRVISGRDEEMESIPRDRRCRGCRLNDIDNPRCRKCRKLNPPEREPGDEGDKDAKAEEKALPKVGSVLFDSDKFHKELAQPLSMVVRVAMACGHTDGRGGVKDTPELSGLRRRYDDLAKDSEKLARKMIEKQTKGI